MEAVFGEATARLVEAQRETTMSEDAFTNVIALGRAYIDWAMGNPELYRVMFMVTQGWEPSAEALANAMSALEPLAAEVARVPELDLPVESAALTLWSGVHGFCSLILLGAIRLPEEQFAAVREATLATLARGLRP